LFSDITNFQVSRESQLRRLEQNKVAWMELQNTEPAKSSTLVFEYISDVLSWISEKERNGHFEQVTPYSFLFRLIFHEKTRRTIFKENKRS